MFLLRGRTVLRHRWSGCCGSELVCHRRALCDYCPYHDPAILRAHVEAAPSS